MRLHSKYNLPSVTSQMAQRTFETAAQRLTEAQKSLVADYLTHSSATAEKHYRMKQCDIIVKTSQLLSNMSKVSRAEPSGEGTRHGAVPYSSPIKQPVIRLPRLPSHNEKVKFFKAFETLLQTYPLSLNGKRPEVKQRRNVSQEFQRKLHTYWGRKQLEMREAHTRSNFSRRKPTKERLEAWIKRQGWKMTAGLSDEVLKNWAPSGSEDCTTDSKQIQKLV
ncbi:uncharacterized protein LOC118298856 [Scophthalmus maximus]|uniref:uncharacterized protein LOC118298856 n=1 Tax=Scophthalmus maximus TaxID=52904 RepID=UPI001FA8FE40|nr:uncharacterized protein LOC118298856 [Scophthalmus maximus]XP_047186382.1 uncharacterized protein LOC118298856 [Scophthalmus maximus]XP_047186383.1 uncharacterized protein LOC118298856 [Scophthalmus maximus]